MRIKGFGQLERDHRHGKHPASIPLSYQLSNGNSTIVGGLCAELAAGTHANCSGLLHGAFLLAFADPSNAGPEWQARSLGWRSRELLAAYPLKGLVGKCSSPVAETSQDGVSTRQISQYLNQATTGGRP